MTPGTAFLGTPACACCAAPLHLLLPHAMNVGGETQGDRPVETLADPGQEVATPPLQRWLAEPFYYASCYGHGCPSPTLPPTCPPHSPPLPSISLSRQHFCPCNSTLHSHYHLASGTCDIRHCMTVPYTSHHHCAILYPTPITIYIFFLHCLLHGWRTTILVCVNSRGHGQFI